MRAFIALLCLALPASSLAQPAAPAPPAPALTATGAFFALSVADVRASAQWYREKLGLKVVMDPPKQGTTAVVVLEGNGLIVELIQDDQAAAPATKNPMLVHGVVKAGVIVSDFDQTLATLKERNVPIAFGPYPAKANQRANVIIRDNAGNLIQLFGQ
jgi:catechol-2,3-dioxygenase